MYSPLLLQLAGLLCLLSFCPQLSLPEASAQPLHSPLCLEDVSPDDAVLYFSEVCLDSEFINSGDPSYVQKWTLPISYALEGDYTDSDAALIGFFADFLNGIEGFPGISPAEDPFIRNLRICFCSSEDMVSLLGPNFENMDGGVTFWYTDDEIYDAIICIRSDLEQPLRGSVILEELYNALGPIQDTTLRPDSLIYQEYSETQQLTPVDELILKLLYHPDMLPGMDAAGCEQLIRSLYY